MRAFREALIRAIEGWNKDPLEDEWLFETFRDEELGCMSPPEAFEAVADTIDLLLVETDESTATELLQTLIALARKSGTTEVPRALEKNKGKIEKQFSSRGDYARSKLHELFRYYRID